MLVLALRFIRVTPSDPLNGAPAGGGGLGGPERVYHQKSSVNSGVSIVVISKMISIFILLYPQHPQGPWHLRGVGLGRPEGGSVLYYQKSCVKLSLGFSF